MQAFAPYPNEDGSIPQLTTGIERKWATYYGGMIFALHDDDEVQRWTASPLDNDGDVASALIGENKNRVMPCGRL